MKIYVVGHHGPEHNQIISIHKSREGAVKAWNKVRLRLLNEAKRLAKSSKYDHGMWSEMIKNLSCKDPDKIDNYPHETPHINMRELEK